MWFWLFCEPKPHSECGIGFTTDIVQGRLRECGPRMLMYMIKIGNYMTQLGNRYTFGTLKTELDHLMVHERRSATITEHSLAHNTRTAIIETVQHKQMELKSI